MDNRKKKHIAKIWAEMLADMFDNDVFFDMMDEKLEPSAKTPLGEFELGKKIGINKKVVGESVTNVGGNSYSVSPVVFDASKLNPEITKEELVEMDKEENERRRKK